MFALFCFQPELDNELHQASLQEGSSATAVVRNSWFPINLQHTQLQHSLNLQHTVNLGERETGIAQWFSGLQDLLTQYTMKLKDKATQ